MLGMYLCNVCMETYCYFPLKSPNEMMYSRLSTSFFAGTKKAAAGNFRNFDGAYSYLYFYENFFIEISANTGNQYSCSCNNRRKRYHNRQSTRRQARTSFVVITPKNKWCRNFGVEINSVETNGVESEVSTPKMISVFSVIVTQMFPFGKKMPLNIDFI